MKGDRMFATTNGLSERGLVALLAAVAFVVALNATVMFPLGPFLVAEVGGRADAVGYLGAVYSLAAAVGGFAASFVLDRFDRRDALACCVGAFTLAIGASAAAPDMAALMLTRALAGCAAGPLWGLLIAVASDVVPPQRRGLAVGRLVGTYGLALVLGLPAGTLLAAMPGGWRWALLALALGGGAISAVTVYAIGPHRGHLSDVVAKPFNVEWRAVFRLIAGQPSLIAFLLIAAASFSALLVSPNLPVFVLRNTGLGPTGLSAVYLLGGALTLAVVPLAGRTSDRFGALPVAAGAALTTTLVLGAAFLGEAPLLPALPILAMVLVLQLVRSTVSQGSATRVPLPAERAAFQSLAAAVTNLAQAIGAGTAPLLLSVRPNGMLAGMDRVAWLAIAASWTAPLLLMRLETVLRRRGLPPVTEP
ncbi:MFS transporter [Inquilinus sp. CA228]|uniref:MFS transporter n=1 Tax=Inquilinus sp. CA228 TaxID=3455609 RepID=UPI003F8D8A78